MDVDDFIFVIFLIAQGERVSPEVLGDLSKRYTPTPAENRSIK